MKRAQILAGFSIAAIALAFPAMSDAPKAPPLEPVHVPYERTCQDTQITVYFSKQESVLSSYAVRSLNTAGDQLAGCAVSDIEASVVSADAIDDMAATSLSEARAAVVLEALNARGIRARDIRTAFVSAAEANPSDALTSPMARRVDLTVTAATGYGL